VKPERDIGLVGCGEIAHQQHGPFLLGPANDTGLRLVATADPRQELSDGLRHYPDHQAMLAAEPTLAAISIASPTGTHAAVAKDVLRAGRHVLLEKPPATTLTELDALARLAAEQGRVLVTSFHARHNPTVARLRELLEGRQPPRHLNIQWRENFERWHAGQTWPWRPDGFGVFDPGINALSILCHVLPGLAFRVTEARFRMPAGAATPSFVQMHLAWEGGQGSVTFEWRKDGEDVWDIALDSPGPEGKTEALLLRSVRRLLRDGEVVTSTTADEEYAGVYRAFRDALDSGESGVSRREMQIIEEAQAIAVTEPTDEVFGAAPAFQPR
jgi:predicted dehydrogenase